MRTGFMAIDCSINNILSLEVGWCSFVSSSRVPAISVILQVHIQGACYICHIASSHTACLLYLSYCKFTYSVPPQFFARNSKLYECMSASPIFALCQEFPIVFPYSSLLLRKVDRHINSMAYGTRSFYVFTRALEWSLSWAESTQFLAMTLR